MLKPKEKAKELYWEFYQNVSDTSFPEETAKKCSLKVVYEIIKLHCGGCMECGGLDIEYWQEVKTELEKI